MSQRKPPAALAGGKDEGMKHLDVLKELQKLTTPQGAGAAVRTVWIIDTGEHSPRLVTAYPV